jgi:RNA polymerase sigma-70 factor (ECF subfamily)
MALNRIRQGRQMDSNGEVLLGLPSMELTPEEEVLKKERQEVLVSALEMLSPKEKLMFYRKYYYLQSTAQIASELGTTERAVEGRLYRIKKQLRKILGGEESE